MEATPITETQANQKNNMGISINKDGKIVKTTIKVRDLVLYSEVDFPLLLITAIIFSAINIVYALSNFNIL